MRDMDRVGMEDGWNDAREERQRGAASAAGGDWRPPPNDPPDELPGTRAGAAAGGAGGRGAD